MDIQSALKNQYHAALATLRDVIARCGEDLWTEAGTHPSPFWQVAYHAVFYTDLYSRQRDEDFSPCPMHREQVHFLQELPWPPHDPPELGKPYTIRQVLEYLDDLAGRIDGIVDGLDLETGKSGFSWYTMPKLEHQMLNIRHAQHHAAQLADRLERATNHSIEWISSRPRR